METTEARIPDDPRHRVWGMFDGLQCWLEKWHAAHDICVEDPNRAILLGADIDRDDCVRAVFDLAARLTKLNEAEPIVLGGPQ